MKLFTSAPFADDTDPALGGAIILTDANIEEDFGGTEWNVATAYAQGDVVFVAATHRRYEALSANTGQSPPDNPTIWLDIGATNLWRAFDKTVQSQTLADGTDLRFEFTCNTLVTAIALFNVSGERLIVRMSPPGAGHWDDNEPTNDDSFLPTIDFVEREFQLIDTSFILDWFDWFFAETVALREVLIADLPGFSGATFEIEIIGVPQAAVGEIAAGAMQTIGTTLTGGRLSLDDFSRVEDDFDGSLIVVRRGAADIVEFPVFFPGTDAMRVWRIMRGLTALPTVFVSSPGDEQMGFFTYGILRSFITTATDRNAYFAAVEVRGLV